MVAVKILHDAEVGSVNFVREIAILKGCRHTNIVQFQVCPFKSTTLHHHLMPHTLLVRLWTRLSLHGKHTIRVILWPQGACMPGEDTMLVMEIVESLCKDRISFPDWHLFACRVRAYLVIRRCW